MNRAAFFDAVRAGLFANRLSAGQVVGMNVILDEWQRSGSGDSKQLAYVLATTLHETARTCQPIHERGRRLYFDKYEPGTRIGKRLGNTRQGDGYLFRGRGFVQITGRSNYERMGRRMKVDLVSRPDLALQPHIAARILITGMTDGMFTGRKLADYIGAGRCDYVNARRIVNGTDRAALIAGYAEWFHAAIEAAHIPAPPDVAPISDPDLDMRPLPEDRSVVKRLGTAVAVAFTAAAAWITENPAIVIGGLSLAGGAIAFIIWRNRK